ncbi:site-specific integrase [Streptomyces qinzhouensis]|uniref:Site-specific integrase n=1 Tax=Streptomyces qinzhouensis TaxID=2599401 RepID=A0A5B8JF05_9ACTN|nr:site-specific integrase [Streptomyces qinzhouensis]QDY80365.1 site-specific integrase [Streptomyces qinzhouensis]
MANGSTIRREHLADRLEFSPPAVLEGQATIFEMERDWRPLAGALLPTPLPSVKALLADFARYATEHRWSQKVHEPTARVLRVAATWLGAETVFREDEVRAMHRVCGGKGRIRGLVSFLDQRQQLVPSPPRRETGEAFVQRTIAACPPRISDELGTWVGVLRGTSRSHHRVTNYATLRRYLIYLATPLADWTTRYTTLRQVTEADVTAAVTAVKGPRAHERAVAVRSLFRALKHAKLVFVDPTRGLRITRQELLPTTLAPDRLAGLLETSSNPATRLVLALVALHATSGTELRNLVLSDVLLTRRHLLIRRPHYRHVVHLDDTTAALLHAWLRYRHQRWPRTVNSHLLVTQQTPNATDPVSADYVYRRLDPAGLTLRAVRADRILDEACETEDPVHLVRVFGISITTAMKYIHTAHPQRGGPIPP